MSYVAAKSVHANSGSPVESLTEGMCVVSVVDYLSCSMLYPTSSLAVLSIGCDLSPAD